jgi:hypothetical protein
MLHKSLFGSPILSQIIASSVTLMKTLMVKTINQQLGPTSINLQGVDRGSKFVSNAGKYPPHYTSL